jgi:NAD(P)-dependent dehydrogenase (short-subunit alcohol dehydrogenase family)
MNARSVVVTGASTGIGRATVSELVSAGFHVFATVRKQSDADSLLAELGESVTPLLVDLRDHDSVRAAGELVSSAGPLHGLVNNAGVAFPGPLEYLPIEAFQQQLEVNLVGQLLMTQVLLPALVADGDARIAFIGSISGRIAGPILGAYSASKHAVVGLVGSLRAELAPYGVRVSLIEPGVIATPIWESAAATGDEILANMPADAPRYAAQIAGTRTRVSANTTGGLDPHVVGRAVAKVMTSANPKPRQVVGRDAKIGALLVRVLPFRAVYRITAAKA